MTYRTRTASFRRSLTTSLAHNLGVALALGVVVLFSLIGHEKESVTRPAAEGSAAALVEAHGCAGQDDPTHAVVTVDGRTRYVGQRMTDKAIEQAVFGVDHGLVVHEFCR